MWKTLNFLQRPFKNVQISSKDHGKYTKFVERSCEICEFSQKIVENTQNLLKNHEIHKICQRIAENTCVCWKIPGKRHSFCRMKAKNTQIYAKIMKNALILSKDCEFRQRIAKNAKAWDYSHTCINYKHHNQ